MAVVGQFILADSLRPHHIGRTVQFMYRGKIRTGKIEKLVSTNWECVDARSAAHLQIENNVVDDPRPAICCNIGKIELAKGATKEIQFMD